jgi:NADH:ubiquinone reductase (non-electrogenic)
MFILPIIYKKTYCYSLNNNKKKIVIVGNGFAGTTFIKNFNNNNYDLTVISPDSECTYTPLIPYKSIKNNNSIISKSILDISNNFDYINSSVIDIDLDNKKIITDDGNKIEYDYVIFAHGIENNTYNINGIDKYCYILNKNNINSIYNNIKSLKKNSNIAVIGCGPSGSEVIGHLIDLNKFNIMAIDGLSGPLNSISKENSSYTINHWDKCNVNMHFNTFVKSINSNIITTKSMNSNNLNYLKYDMAIWCGGYKDTLLTNLLKEKLNHVNKNGFHVNNYMQVKNNPRLYAIGDCSNIDSKYPQTAQVAYQQAKYLSNNFNNNFENVKPFKYHHNGTICYIGKYNSIYEYNKYSITGIFGYIFNNISHIYNYFKVF